MPIDTTDIFQFANSISAMRIRSLKKCAVLFECNLAGGPAMFNKLPGLVSMSDIQYFNLDSFIKTKPHSANRN